jgi:N-methylhydantoinase A
MIDIRTIGAGGGSLAWIDRAGMLHVGPRSAGANPGPACYGFGGTGATVTDANVVLGRISPANFLGGAMTLDPAAAADAVGRMARQIGKSTEETALAIVRIANNTMVGALRAALIEEGLDPRDFTLLAFGGAGPVHAGDLMQEASIPRGIVPNHPGQFSAYGFTMTDARVDRYRSALMISKIFDPARANAVMGALAAGSVADLRAQGYGQEVRVQRALEMRYLGQNHELDVAVDFETFDDATIPRLWSAFHRAHETRYGFAIPGELIEIVTFKCTATAAMAKPELARLAPATGVPVARSRRRVVFEAGAQEAPIFDRLDLLQGHEILGPAVVEEAASVTPVRPGHRLTVDAFGNLHLSAA